MSPKKQDCGSDGLAIQDVIEIKPGENLLGFDSEPPVDSGGSWLSIVKRSERSIFLHTIPGSILLSYEDFDGCLVSIGKTPEESLTIPQPSSDSEETDAPSVSSTPSTTTKRHLKKLAGLSIETN